MWNNILELFSKVPLLSIKIVFSDDLWIVTPAILTCLQKGDLQQQRPG